MRWTNEQQQAIAARNCGLIVSAAAGSGKTAVLVERLTQLLCDAAHPIPADRIIVVTFTNDAAVQVKNRLQISLEKRMKSDDRNAWLQRQHLLLQHAKICTISSFCFDLIRDHATEVGLTTGFRILDETEHNLLCRKTADAVINNWYEVHSLEMDLLWDTFCEKNDTPIEELILELHRFFGSVPFRKQWVKHTMKQFQKTWQESSYYLDLAHSLQEKLHTALTMMEESGIYAQDLYEGENNVLDWIYDDEAFTQKLCHMLTDDATEYAEILRWIDGRIEQRKGKRFPMKRKTMQNSYRYPIVKAKRDQYEAILKDCFQTIQTILPYCESDLSIHRELVPILLHLEQDFDNALWEAKIEKNGLSFDDGERLVLELLTDSTSDMICPSALAQELSSFYKLIMIDEYQDSNNKQDYIFKLLSHNSFNIRTKTLTYGDNIFLVGDVKQSIYRFRLANPKNFLHAIETAAPYETQSAEPVQHISLNRNFRSAQSVINFVNAMFSGLMTPACGDLFYDQQQYLIKGTTIYDALSNSAQGVEITFLSDDENSMNQAEYVAHRIGEMLAQQVPVASGDGMRPCEPRDFCILIRNGDPSKAFVKALEDRHIPVRGGEEKGYLQSQEISLLLEMLRILDNPLLDTSLAAVLLSPMFMVTAEELARLRLANRNSSLYASMQLWMDSNQTPKSKDDCLLLEKCHVFMNLLHQLRTESILLPLDLLIQKIYDTTDVLSVMQLYKDGNKKRANLQLLLQYAHQYEANNQNFSRGITGFLRHIDYLCDSGDDLKQAKSASGIENVVTVTTMHKSKGLEYPFVFLGKTEILFSAQDSRKMVHLLDEGAIGLKLKDAKTFESFSSLPYQVILNQKKKQAYSEELRLLYVAMTRAKQKLNIPLIYNNNVLKKLTAFAAEIPEDGTLPVTLVQSACSMSHWIWLCLLQRYDTELEQCLPDLPSCTWKRSNAFEKLQIQYTDCRNMQLPDELTSDLKEHVDVNLSLLENMKQWIAFQYNTPEVSGFSQLSVSELINRKSQQEKKSIYKRPLFLQQTNGYTGAERGIAVHTYLQYANFTYASENPEQERNRLVHRGYLTPKQASLIVISQVQNFFSSDLYVRLKCAEQVFREYKFLVRLGDLEISPEKAVQLNWSFHEETMLKGIVDLAFIENGQLVIVDYKTDIVTSASQLVDAYRNQLYLYKLAFQVFTKMPVKECWIYSTHLNQAISILKETE